MRVLHPGQGQDLALKALLVVLGGDGSDTEIGPETPPGLGGSFQRVCFTHVGTNPTGNDGALEDLQSGIGSRHP